MKTSLNPGLPEERPPTVDTAAASADLRHAQPGNFVSSEPLAWEGIHLESGWRRGWQVDETMQNGHHLVMNLADRNLEFETLGESRWCAAQLGPLEFWIIPEGRPFSVRRMTEARLASCTIDGRYLDSLAGCHFELDAGIGIADPVLARLIQALVAVIEDQANYSQALAAEVIRAAVNALAVRHGHPAAELKMKGGIAPNQMKSLIAWLQEHIEHPLTVGLMAAQVGLSAAHFSREFKRSTGSTPWDYVVRMRLERAREALLNGACLAGVASQFGFADQSHMARLFKVRFGLSPSAFIKANR
jgi:AraC family transcriptional regulator